MQYNYPRPQEIYNSTLFLMAETVNSNQFSEYIIPYKTKGQTREYKISHDFLTECIDRGIIVLSNKYGAFNNKDFYRIPLQIQLTIC